MKRRKGFTLLEIMICVTIMSIMAGGAMLSAQRFSKVYDRYTDIVILQDLTAIRQGMDIYLKIFSRPPKNLDELFKTNILIGDTRLAKGDYAIEKGVPCLKLNDGGTIVMEDLIRGQAPDGEKQP